MKPIKCYKVVREEGGILYSANKGVMHPELVTTYTIGDTVRANPELLKIGFGLMALPKPMTLYRAEVLFPFGRFKLFEAIGWQTKLLVEYQYQNKYAWITSKPIKEMVKQMSNNFWGLSLIEAFHIPTIMVSSIKLTKEIPFTYSGDIIT